MAERKGVLLRLDPSVHEALARWAADELRSTNAQIDYLLRRALVQAGRMPREARAARGPGRPPQVASDPSDRGGTRGAPDAGPRDGGNPPVPG